MSDKPPEPVVPPNAASLVQPILDRVLVRIHDAPAMSPGGVLLPSTERDRRAKGRGIVVAVGPGRIVDSGERAAMTAKIGDLVFFHEYAGTDLPIETSYEKYRIIPEQELMAVLPAEHVKYIEPEEAESSKPDEEPDEVGTSSADFSGLQPLEE